MTERHFTTRRGFIAAMGFGAVGLYGAWAGYGAAPLPFSSPSEPQDSPHAADAAADHGGHGAAGGMSPEQFLERHEAFLQQFGQDDGSVTPAGSSAPHGVAADAHDMQADSHGGHGAAPEAAPAHRAPADAGLAEPLDVYLLAYRFGFDPADLRLEKDRPYRFRMMASDLAHGASLQLGPASRIIRLRPNVVNEQTITFTRPGTVLVYCTLYCGPGHDLMQGRITVA